MSKRSIAVFVALSVLAAPLCAAPPSGRMLTFDKSTGGTYFAMSLKAEGATTSPGDVIILFDTSASQTGLYRDDGLEALQTMLSGMDAKTRVKLVAVDLNAIPMTTDFVAPESAAMKAGLTKLKGRVPLGSTDMHVGLRAALKSFTADNQRTRSVVYIGDGMSKANLLQNDEFKSLIDDLVAGRAAVNSYAIGPRRDVHLLTVLANHTGGAVYVDADNAAGPHRAGQAMAAAVRSPVFWPTKVDLPAGMTETYPATMPPLRGDRDTIVLGMLKKRGPVKLELTAEVAGKPTKLSWNLPDEKSNQDYGYLPQLVESARKDGGLSLPTAGLLALREAGRVVQRDAEALTKVGMHALRTGDRRGALNIADAALARDPNNPQAFAIRQIAQKGTAQLAQLPAAPSMPAGRANAAPPRVQSAPGDDAVLRLGNANQGGDDRSAAFEQPSLLAQEEQVRQVLAEKLQTQVKIGLKMAREQAGEDAAVAREGLKLLLDKVERSVDVTAELRSDLRRQIENTIREVSVQEIVIQQQRAEAEQAEANARAQREVVDQYERRQVRLVNLMDKFQSLLDEGEYLRADVEVAQQMKELAPFDGTPVAAIWMARNTRQIEGMEKFRDLRHKNFVDVLYEVEEALIPFPATPPIMYPDAAVWAELSERRKKYQSIDLAGSNPSEQKIVAALDDETNLEFFESPLSEVVNFLREAHGINIYIDEKALGEAGKGSDTPVTQNLRGISLRSALRLMLAELDMTYVIKDEVLKITTPEMAESELITKVYPVGDLVLPIISGGSPLGGGGQGGQQGGQGGGGGGFGGGGGGFGGGGGGGGFGGGGGGFFAVEEQLSLGDKPSEAKASKAKASAAAKKNDSPARKSRPRVERTARDAARKALNTDLLPLPNVGAGQSAGDAWDKYFKSQASLSGPALLRHNRQVKQTAAKLMMEAKIAFQQTQNDKGTAKVDHVLGMLQAALRNGQPQPWMYEAIGLAMQANQAPLEEIERALMSAVDFSTDQDSLMYAGLYLGQIGLDKRALQIFQEVSKSNPFRPEPYVKGLAAAQRLNDVEGTMWACTGILSQAWTREQKAVEDKASRVAEAVIRDLRKNNKRDKAAEFAKSLQVAKQRDCMVTVTWTGDADVDMQIQEPGGTICSVRTPRTTAGGVMMGDSFAHPQGASAAGYSETYVCPQGFSGMYHMLIRRVWGKVTAGKVTVKIQCAGEKTIVRQVTLDEKDTYVKFDLLQGRRQEKLGEQQLANLQRDQEAVGRAILAQQASAINSQLENSQAVRNFAIARRQLARNGFFAGRRGAVGFRPVIQVFPEGTQMTVSTAIVSPDRRYVRISIPPFPPIVSGIGEVNTFNFSTGEPGRGLPDNDDAPAGGGGN